LRVRYVEPAVESDETLATENDDVIINRLIEKAIVNLRLKILVLASSTFRGKDNKIMNESATN
jgi:hypothetical protein